MRQASYLERVMERMRQARLQGRLTPGLHHIEVRHDDWCDLLKGTGPCNCNPDVSGPVPHAESSHAAGNEEA
jgi:hypothetical protein